MSPTNLLTWMQNPHPKRKAKLAQDPKTHVLRLRFANMVNDMSIQRLLDWGIATSTLLLVNQFELSRSGWHTACTRPCAKLPILGFGGWGMMLTFLELTHMVDATQYDGVGWGGE